MKTPTLQPSASETYNSLVAELDELRSPHLIDTGLDVDALVDVLSHRQSRAAAIELLLPRYEIEHRQQQLAEAKAAGVVAGNQLVAAAAERGAAEHDYDAAINARKAALDIAAAAHNAANAAATVAWEAEANALEALRLLGVEV
ncbi:MAG: hypothetical protein F2735_00320 [Actinobacteria bacterium]|uniref:Unannotated protein n=1 Tax=freshwater metagenome TaxID=449393 RepID=A0A6J6WPQ6_9ZZZZ|nr:hypothetical protein [Actinomycetota bacterium]